MTMNNERWRKAAPKFKEEIDVAVELLKLVTTTALGFVFAKTQDQPKENSPRQENVGEKLSIG
ncbi:hypothetical protein EML15_05250 [Corynebacterium sp. sy017]|uniref:hypothetical protein n=1 Tax=unclassified Corynebacterium TaxID=2624378 RepID=UPI001185BAC1|nr:MULTISPECIES: hypothetical protein [unclassified Corynebacterium]MBP3088552.1 hypothetical protein [Corynebacterium sp. sy017]TSD91851.1 hypothetical protein ELY17_05250 [Corynebacterium sp. SY003]